VLIVVTAVFAPLAFVGSLADITVAWTRRWIEMTVALIFSKLILVLIFVIGYFMLVRGAGQAGSGVTQEITQVVAGVIVLALAGFAPWLALKVVHFTGDHAQQLHALGASTVGGAMAGARMAQKVSPIGRSTTSNGSNGARGANGSSAEPSPPATNGPGGTSPEGSSPGPAGPGAPASAAATAGSSERPGNPGPSSGPGPSGSGGSSGSSGGGGPSGSSAGGGRPGPSPLPAGPRSVPGGGPSAAPGGASAAPAAAPAAAPVGAAVP
jgi:hypothetical protein